ncbi:MAG: FixH family protein [Sandaracinaceae bacterium]|nr:FixH family protein [Sandaracinaceae bacterium]
MRALAVLLLLSACAERASVDEEAAPTLAAPISARGSRYAVELRAHPAPPRVGELFRVTSHVTTLDGAPARGARVELDATMPQHRHGMVTRPSHRELGDGEYLTEGMKLHMPGRWRLEVIVRGDRGEETLTALVDQPPS